MPSPPLTVWYNTRCPVCDAGIDRQRNKLLAAVQAGTIAFRDINLEPDALAAHGASLEDIRRRLHATDAAGRLLVGADVAFAVWRLTPGERWLATLFGNPVMRPVARFVYDRFADVLYAWNRAKDIGERGNDPCAVSVLGRENEVLQRGAAMTEKPKSEVDDNRPSEDDLAQAHLGGPRGAPELKPAKMTPQRKKKTPGDFDPGHTA